MEILVYIILGSIFGVSVGNTTIRKKIGEEIKQIMSRERPKEIVADCPLKKVKYTATYKPPRKETPPEPKSESKTENKKQSGTLCSECGNPIEIIDKMPGFFYCDNCKRVVKPKKNENARP